MGNIASSAFKKMLPLPLVKTVDLSHDPAHPTMTRIDLVLSLQITKMESSAPFGLFVALINDIDVLNSLKNNERLLRYEISNKKTPSTQHAMIKQHIGVEDFVTDGKIKHVINTRKGTGVVVKDIPLKMDIYTTDDQNLWIYCVAYEIDNEQDNIKIIGSGGNKWFLIGDPVIEPIMIKGMPPTTTYLYRLGASQKGYGEDGDVWVGPVHQRRGALYAGRPSWFYSGPVLTRTKVSNQKIKDLRILQQIEDLDLDNFVVNMQNINKENFKSYERVKQLLGKRYFSRLHYSRSSTGDFKLFFSMDYDAFINDNCRFAGLLTNKASLKSCYAIDEIVIFRKRINSGAEGSSLTDDIVVDKDDMFAGSPELIGSLKKGNVTLLDIDNNNFLNILINDPSMKNEDVNKFQYTVNFEFVDNSALVLKKIVKKLQKSLVEFESFTSKFEGIGKKNFDVEEYLRVNAKVIKTDDSWLKVINEFLASIWFIFGRSGFGDYPPVIWKKNLTTMVNPMAATEKSLAQFTETIKDYISDLQRLVEQSTVGRSEKKFNARSRIAKGKDLIRKIKYTHEPRVVTKSAENGIGFDYLGVGRYVKENDIGLSQLSYASCNQRLDGELQKYQVGNPNATSVNKYGFLSPQRIHTIYEVQDTFADHLELSDGLVILDSRINPGFNSFSAQGPVNEPNIKVSTILSILGSAGINIEPLETTLATYVEGRKEPEELERDADSDNYFSPTRFPISNQYLEDQVSGSSQTTFAAQQAQKRKIKALESDLAERLTDGVAQKFTDPRIRRTSNISGSLALARIKSDVEAFKDLNSFERDINYNSLVKVQILEGFKDGDIRRPRWEILTQNRFNKLREDGSTVVCRLKRCPSVTSPGSSYRLGRFNYLFLLGAELGSQDEIIKTSYRKRLNYYLSRLKRLDKSRITNINRSAANYGAEYYISDIMIFKQQAHRPVFFAAPALGGLKKSKKSKRRGAMSKVRRSKKTRKVSPTTTSGGKY